MTKAATPNMKDSPIKFAAVSTALEIKPVKITLHH